jgi:DNA-binding LacI/PurR family transcriptional regulator
MTRARAPTLHTVARAAGVSTAIVSRVVNGHYHGMSAATRARVEAAVDRLGYFPNRAARSLRTRRHHRIAFIAVDSSPEFLADPFTTYVVAGLSNALSEQDYGLLVQRLNRRAPLETLLMRAQDADAITLFMSGPQDERLALIERFRELGLPLLVFQEVLAPIPDDVCVVRQDDRAGGRWLGERMQGHGLLDVLAVVPELAWPAIEARLAGLRDGLAERAGLTVLEVAESDMQAISAVLDRQLRAHVPEAIFASNDQLAAQAIGALERIGRRVPADVRVSGFNCLPITGAVQPPLTTIRSPAFELGTRAADLLVLRLAEGRFETKELVLPVEPQAGQSL